MYETTFSEIIQRFCYMQINLFNIWMPNTIGNLAKFLLSPILHK